MFPMALPLPRTQATDLPGRVATMDEAAFHHFYQRTARSLRAYLLRSCGDLALADDVCLADEAGAQSSALDLMAKRRRPPALKQHCPTCTAIVRIDYSMEEE